MTEKDNSGPRSVFNIGSQQAANINNVAGDMNIAGGQQVTLTLADARRDIALLQQGLNGLALPSTDRQTAAQALAGAAQSWPNQILTSVSLPAGWKRSRRF